MSLPNGEGLYLTIDRVVERECTHYHEGAVEMILHDGSIGSLEQCKRCDGHGLRKVRVTGRVEVECTVDGYNGDPIEYDSVEWFDHESVTDVDELADIIIAAFHAGTLPPELAAHITEEDCE